MNPTHWQLEVQRSGRDAQLRLAHPSGLCREWDGDVACRLCQRLGLDTGRYPCPKSSAWRLFLLARDLESEVEPTSAPAPAPETDWDARLRTHGLRPTPARRAIAALLLGGPRHVTTEEVSGELARAGYRYALSTVSRTLKEFADWDLLQVLDLGGGVVFYDTVTTPHPHVYNVDTGELSDLSPEEAWVSGLPELPAGVRLEGIQLVFRVRGAAAQSKRSAPKVQSSGPRKSAGQA
ncbi:Fur family transcriptional regulator [Thioalkalivibrio sp. XN279]|uniref:Fur family transcriptional regulator n=1 Tax=Thioalkalivibrio sp. XN279 TaxID=2714953 RepID=UPI00140B1342|nr:transcriptional repressor [Thioalkalivibrio sp. XN279]NHA14087.1 transcriptional repressor [Thioalkalivibrio sp. XN279]